MQFRLYSTGSVLRRTAVFAVLLSLLAAPCFPVSSYAADADDGFLSEDDPVPGASSWEDPRVTDEEGNTQVWDTGGQVYAWIPLPGGFYINEEESNRYCLSLLSEDTDSLNAEIVYYVYNADDGYLDINMDDPMLEEAGYLEESDGFSWDGPSDIQKFDISSGEAMGVSLSLNYEAEDTAPQYTTEYLVWTHPDEHVIVTCSVQISSANPDPGVTMEEAAEAYLSEVSATQTAP